MKKTNPQPKKEAGVPEKTAVPTKVEPIYELQQKVATLEKLLTSAFNRLHVLELLNENQEIVNLEYETRLSEIEKHLQRGPVVKNWQSCMVNKSVGFFPIYKNGDANGDGFTSLAEAVEAAQNHIIEQNLQGYSATALPLF